MGTVLCEHGGIEGEIKECVMKGSSVVGLLAEVMKGRKCNYGHEEGSEE